MMTENTKAEPGDTCIIWIGRDETDRGVVNRGVPGVLVEHITGSGWRARFHPDFAPEEYVGGCRALHQGFNWAYSELDVLRVAA